MAEQEATTRRDFIRQVGAVAAAGAVGPAGVVTAARHTAVAVGFSKGRVIGANDRINVGFVGCGGRMNAHIGTIPAASPPISSITRYRRSS